MEHPEPPEKLTGLANQAPFHWQASPSFPLFHPTPSLSPASPELPPPYPIGPGEPQCPRAALGALGANLSLLSHPLP
jgi:hypothetical protein